MTPHRSSLGDTRRCLEPADLERCIFPAFDGSETDLSGRMCYLGNLETIVDQDAAHICSILCAAWGILLQCFIGVENVSFVFDHQRIPNTDTDYATHSEYIAHLSLPNEKIVRVLVEEIAAGGVLLSPFEAHIDRVNTRLSFRSISGAQNPEDIAGPPQARSKHTSGSPGKVHMIIDPTTFRIILSWAGSFMTQEQAKNVTSTYGRIVSQIITNPDALISNIDCFSESNLRQVLAWNSKPKNHIQRCIHEVISENAISRPEAEAVCAWDGSFSYTDLITLSDQLAHRLTASGVGSEVFVPICFDKSRFTIVAMLAVLKAGGIFVPLDPTHPVPRLQALAHKVGATTVLCSRQHLSMLETVARERIAVDSQLFVELSQAEEDIKQDIKHASWENGAYMIFTSGTTGEPKGALIQHGALLSSAFAHGPAMMMDSNTRSLQFAASTFDVSITEILSCLILGGCVCVPSEEARLNSIEEAIVQLKVNWALLTPTFVRFINPANVPCLQTLVTGGEAMTEAIIRSWSHINLINCYGPAETSVVSHVHRGMTEGKNPLNIGYPVGIHCWVVDRYDHNRLVPIGAVGELVIEGHTLAREYFKEPGKSREAFICDPLWTKHQPAGAEPRRMYKTGDLVKYNHDGSFHIAGRLDTQIKYHGQRIELGEIEHHLNVIPSIKHGMVVLPQEGHCQGRLLTVIQLSDVLGHDLVSRGQDYKLISGELGKTAKKKIAEAKSILKERLPAYMIPSLWIAVEFIPRLQSGKLDRKQTSRWIRDMSESLYRQLNPAMLTESLEDMMLASKTEIKIHDVWIHVLNLKENQLGLRQSFLSVGGDSITAMQVMSECKKRGLGLTVRHIVGCKSITELASHVKDIETPLFHDEVLEKPFDLSPIQKLYFSRPNHSQGHYNQSFLLRTSQRILASDLRAAIEKIVQRHSMLRARFQKNANGEWKQRITNEVASSYRLRTLALASTEDIDTSLVDSQTCLSETDGPLFAADIIDVNGDKELLFVVAHHLVIDLVSWRVILQELEELLVEPDIASIKDQPLPFQIWCKMQAEHAQDYVPDHVMPIDGVPDGNAGYWGMDCLPNVYGDMVHEGFEIEPLLTSRLLSECHNALRTEVPDILLASLLFSFGQTFTDRLVPAVFAEGHGRESWDASIDLSNVVGWFTTIYPIFTGTSAQPSFVDTLKLVKDGRRRIPDRGRPYFASRWLTEKGKDAFERHWPLEITFNYLGQYQQLERDGALFKPARSIAGETRGAIEGADIGPLTTCISLFEISAVILKGRLRFSFAFNKNMHHQPRIHHWIVLCQDTLRTNIEKLSAMAPEPTLSDFPLLSLTYDRLQLMIDEKLPKAGVASVDMVQDVYPCSPMQSGLLVSTAKNSSFYAAYTLHEVKSREGRAVDSARLAKAWRRMVEYHPMLRTIFIESVSEQDSLYDQVVLGQVAVPLHQFVRDTDDDAINTLSSSTKHQTDSSQLLHRFQICTSNTGKVFCRLDISHIIMDGASLSIIFRDLALAYESNLESSEGPKYRNYIGYLGAQPAAHSIEYFSSYLAGAQPCHFPILDDGIPAETKELRSIRVHFDRLKDLQTLCEHRGLTKVNAIYTAWALILSLYTGSEDVCFGYLTSARDAPVDGIEDVVGPVINMVACRATVSKSTTFGIIMSNMQKDYLDSLAHRHLPLADVQHALNLSDTALFNTALSYRKLPPAEQHPPDVIFEEFRPTYDPDEYSVSINIEAGEEIMAIDLTYWTDTLSDGQAANIVDAFTKGLTNILDHCDLTVAELYHLGDASNSQLSRWNRQMPEAIEANLHNLISDQASLRPEAPAIASSDMEFTYADLDRISTKLAVHLKSCGVKLETFVLLCFEKSAMAIVAMIAILKAGGVCVPLDPTHPDSALRHRSEDTGASLALASRSMVSRLGDLVPHTVAVDTALLRSLNEVNDLSLPQVQPSNACFVIYTSGSTGKPKGVVLEHRGIATTAEYSGASLGYHPDSRVLQFASYTFDNSLAEIFTTLTRGGCVCVPSDQERLNDLAGVINRLEVTFMDITPTVACFLQPSEVPTLKTIALGGEAVTLKCVEMWRDFVSLTCCYGPSECSINCTFSGAIAQPGQATNIGRAIGCVAWVVDPHDHSCLLPIGCAGELLIDGPIVSRGYLNLPENTEQSFIRPPAWLKDVSGQIDPDRRLYKTGDLVRYNTDGALAYLGRKDTQVKLNGQRIELGEIEHHVEQALPEGTQSAVELVVANGVKSLACFICIDTESSVPAADADSSILPMCSKFNAQAKELEVVLSYKVPSYSVPSIWLPMSQMPLTSSGKLNRRGLRLQAQAISLSDLVSYKLASRSGRAPSSENETKLAAMWASVLNIEKGSIGAEDNFFKLGGDSIGAMRLVTLARKSNVNLTVGSIFQKTSLWEMADSASPLSNTDTFTATPFSLITRVSSLEKLKEEIALKSGIDKQSLLDIYPCTAIQEGLMALTSKDPGAYVAQLVYRLAKGTDLSRFKSAWDVVVKMEPILRTRIVHTEDLGFVQAVTNDTTSWTQATGVSGLQESDRHLPAYNGGKLSTYAIVEECSGIAYFVWTIHHALYDGWCLPIILEKVRALYESLPAPGEGSSPPYSSFIKYLAGLETRNAAEYWQETLSGTSSQPFPRLPSPGYQASAKNLKIHKTSFIRQLETGFTAATSIRAAWALTLSAYTASSDVLFLETVTGRDAPVVGIEHMVGPTLATVPRRMVLEDTVSVAEFLGMVQNQATAAFSYQHIGIQHIQRLNSEIATTCDSLQNLIAINNGARITADPFWDEQNGEMAGTNFYTYPLMLSCHIGDDELETVIHFDRSVISDKHLDRVMDHFAFMLFTVSSAEMLHERLGHLDLLSPADREQLKQWNRKRPPVTDCRVHDMIKKRGDCQNQDKPAVCAWDLTFTYVEVDSLANQLASILIDYGVGVKSIVPLCLDKSAYVVVSVLGILKTGAAFVPLDPTYPDSRISGILADVEAGIIVCSPPYNERFKELGYRALSVSKSLFDTKASRVFEISSATPSCPAYVIFTSGTTGKPKGTIVSHSAFCTGAIAHGQAMGMNETSRVLQFASHTFDASIMEMLTTLIFGGTVCIPSNESRMNDLTGAINALGVNWALLTPSVAQTIQPSLVPGLKTLVLGGEAMSVAHISMWASAGVQLMNAYGPSEAAVVAAVNPRVSAASGPSNIGNAVGGTCWITDLNNHHRLVPIGAVGELVLEGPILAEGYLNNPTKTDELFILNPGWCTTMEDLTDSRQRRMYKTGDLAKLAEDGSIMFQGRKDNQVKINGQRLELSEVEHHLSTDPAVQYSLAAIPSSGPCKSRLVAILTLSSLAEVSQRDKGEAIQFLGKHTSSLHLTGIRERVVSHLASYMVPAKWIVVSRLPLLPSGKLDRRQAVSWVETMSNELYQQVLEVEESSSALDRDASEAEAHMRTAWGKVLNSPVDRLPFNQSFLHLGGDSISAMQLVSVCRSLNISVTVAQIMQSKSIVDLAAHATSVEDVVYHEQLENQVLPLSPIQKVYFDCLYSSSTHFNQSVLLSTTRPISFRELSTALEKIIKTHSMLRSRFTQGEDEWCQYISSDVAGSYKLQAHSNVARHSLSTLICLSQQSLNILEGPLVAVDMFEMQEDQKPIIFLAAHHLIVDVVSWNIIVQDLEVLLSTKPETLPQPLSFHIWNTQQLERAKISGADMVYHKFPVPSSDFSYWGMQNVANLHGDVTTHSFDIDAHHSLLLLGPCHDAFQTDVLDVLLASLLESFRQSFPDRLSVPAIFNEGHGRESWDTKMDLSRTVGWFTTLCPIYLPSSLPEEVDLLDAVCWIKDFRRRVPEKGRPYFARSILSQDQHQDNKQWPVEIAFNYLGQTKRVNRTDSIFKTLDGSMMDSVNSQTDIGPTVPRLAVIEISASMQGEVLRFEFSYNHLMHRQNSIQNWAQTCESVLKDVIQALSEAKSEPTMEAFPLLPLEYRGVARIREKLLHAGITSLGNIETAYPCSSVQQGILFTQMRNPDCYAYQITFEVHPTQAGDSLDLSSLTEAWQAVVDRHSVLRTIFLHDLLEEGIMSQVVLKTHPADVAFFECTDGEPARMLGDQSSLGLPENQPPHRLRLCKTSEGRVVCRLEMSHAISDGTSMPILFRDLALAYQANLPKSTLAVYGNYVAYLQTSLGDSTTSYWKTYLDGVEPCHFPTATNASRSRALHTFDQKITSAMGLQRFCAEREMTLSSVLQFAWAVVLQAYTGLDEVCFGYLVSGRDIPVQDINEAIGVFINMLVCRVIIDKISSVKEATQSFKTNITQGMDHRQVSLADLQHEMNTSGMSLFNTAYSFQRRSMSKKMVTGLLSFDVLDAYDPNEYDLTVNVEVWDSSAQLQLCYWADKISDSEAENVAFTYDQILTSLVSCDINDPLGELNIFSAHCSEQLQRWNEVEPIFLEECVHHVVERNTMKQPLATVAIQAWDGTFTYKELNDAASRLAQHLIVLGVKSETYVPLCFEKSAWNVVSMIAVLKAGAAFVPLDPSYPAERISFLVQSVDSSLVLCSPTLAQKFHQLDTNTFAVNSSSMSELPYTTPNSNAHVTPNVTPNSPAYIIFTSGTTGLPKGTIVEHGAFTTGGTAHARAIKMTSSSRVLQFASHTFDASIMEILSTLLAGGCICIPNDEERLNDLSATIRKYDINWTLLTPSVANVLKPGSVPNLRVLVTGGEAMSRDHITKWAQHASLINAYGPSETSVIAATSTKVDENGAVHDEDPSTIGHAVGSRCWVVDPRNHNRLMPVGSIGELLVEGPIVARGYLNNAAKTREAFIEHPPWRESMQLAGHRKDRMYKTGDLVAYNVDGSLSYKTRKDTQVKLNGQRLELGEIEHHVKAHLPSGFQSVTELVVPQSKTSAKALAVYFTDEDTPENDIVADIDNILLPMSNTFSSVIQSLRTALRSSLPSYMVPTVYIPITKMPWTSAGKLDRSRLRTIVERIPSSQIGAYKLALASQKRKPTTPMQLKLHRVWREVLKLDADAISNDDSFFRVGGDSIGAMRLVAAARLEDIILTVMTVFQHPKLSEMADFCQWAVDSNAFVVKRFSLLHDVPSLGLLLEELAAQCQVFTTNIQDAYPCSPLQEGLMTLSLRERGAYVAENVFELHQSVELVRFKQAWQRTVDENDILRSRMVNTQSLKSYQVVLEPQAIAWEHVVGSKLTDGSKAGLPDRNGGNLARYKIVSSPGSKHRYFVWTLHHALYDGWSMHSLMQTVSRHYHHEVDAQHVPPVPFANFIKYLADVDVNQSDRFWRFKFETASPTHFPPVLAELAQHESKTSTLTRNLQYSRSELDGKFTMPTVIRATWALVLASQTDSEDVVYGETLSGRDVPLEGVEEILGPTLATIPVRVRIDHDATVGQLLQRLHEDATAVIPYQHAGLQHIKRLDDAIAVACSFNNLLVIQFSAADDDSEQFMRLKDNHTVSDSFFTYPLVLECAVESNKLLLTFHHNEAVISSWHVQRIAHQFNAMLQQVIFLSQDPMAKIADLERCSPEDTNVIKEWNSFDFQHVEESIPDLFLRTTAERPNATAIHAWDGQMSYSQVHHYACLLAKLLVQSGVQSESLIPCCMEKSMYTSVALMAVVLAGGGLVPLDPAHPPARHAEIIQNCGSLFVLCSTQHQGRFADFAGDAIVIDADFFNELMHREDITAQVLPKVAGQDTAFVIYTSGSTGTPKGVVIEHRSFNTSFKAFSARMNISASSRIFHFSSYAFDIAMGETFGALTMGACLCVPSEDMRTGDLPGAMNTLSATWAFLAPSVAGIQDPTKFTTLETLVCGGEALKPDTIATWADRVELMNGYGPAECTIFSVANAHVSTQRDHSRIGQAMSGGRTWIVDPKDHNYLAPLGCVGELLMEGPIVARGYFNDATKTAASFIENPDWAHQFVSGAERRSMRLYKTGDLVKYCPDGTLTFMGRQDTQVKLRGQRMELGEIEANIASDPRVFHTQVSLPTSGLCKGRLVAIISLHGLASDEPLIGSSKLLPVSTSDKSASTEIITAVQDHLAECLPPYMMPSIWFVVQTIPLLVSGKLDRKNTQDWLAKIDKETYQFAVSHDIAEDFAQPVTTAERLIRSVWSSVLNIDEENVPVNQSFLSLGGDSILAMQAMTRCRNHSINLSMQAIIKCKSIEDLAKNINMESQTKISSAPAYEEKFDQFFTLSPIQQLFFNNNANKTEGDRFNQSQLLAVQLQYSKRQYELAVRALVERHSMLRSRFTKNAHGEWTQFLSPDVESSYAFRHHQIMADADMTAYIANSQDSINIAGPVLIVDLFEKQDGTQLVFLIAHHLVVDVVSWLIIIQDLAEYLKTSSMEATKSMSFQEWSLAQARHAKFREHEPDSTLPFALKPADADFWGMREAKNTYGDAIHKSFICGDPDVVNMALGQSHEALGSEPLDLFISALLQSFGLIFAERELPTLFNEAHGREPWEESMDLSQTVGWFTALYPVQISQNSTTDTIEIVRRVKDARRSITSNGRPYFAHRYLTKLGRKDLSHHEPMEILVNYLGRTQQKKKIGSLLEPYDYPKTEEASLQMSDVAPETQRLALFEISISVVEEGIGFSFIYNKQMLHQNRINEWVSKCHLMLITMTRGLSEASKTPTLSDLPLMPINYAELDKLLNESLHTARVDDYTEVEDIYPCSPMQTGILLSQLQNPGRYLFHTVVEIKPTGSVVDPVKLSEACALVVDRHPALRTIFTNSVYRGGTFDQIVLKPRNHNITMIKCREIEVMAKLDAQSLEETNKGPGPSLPYQITICHTQQGKVFMKFEMNHAITDGASTSLIMGDISRAYIGDLPSTSPPSYRDYIKYVSTGSLDSSFNFWITYLFGARAADFPALNGDSTSCRKLGSIELDFPHFSQLQSLSSNSGVTFANILLSAWALILRSYTKSEDVCFGYLASGRDAPIDDIHQIVGPFINMLIFRFQFTPGMLLRTLFEKAQEDYLASLPHQHFSLARVTNALGQRKRSLFNTAVSMQNAGSSDSLPASAFAFESIEAHDPSEYAVTLNVDTTRGDEGIVIRYWSDVLSDSQAQELVSTMSELLSDFIHHGQDALSHLRIFQGPQSPVGRYSSGTSVAGSSSSQEDNQNGMDTSIDCISSRVSTGIKSPNLVSPKRVQTHALARDLLAAKLTRLWKETLEVETIAHKDSFFELGGDSIIAMSMVGNARDLDIALTVADIFKNATFGEMLQVLLKRQTEKHEPSFNEDEAYFSKNQNSIAGDDSYEPFSLLGKPDAEQFIRSEICQFIGISRASILDILPTTDFQAQAIAGQMLESRWMLNHFYLDGSGPLNIHLLRESVANIVASFDILRTVFAQHDGQCLQIILRQLHPSVVVEDVDSVEAFAARLESEHRLEAPRPGDSLVRFIVARQTSSERHRIFIRISHAQYDGVCFPTILSALKACYEGEPIFPAPSYSNYVHGALGKITPSHYAYWRGLLEGSSMTEIVPQDRNAAFQTVPTKVMKQTLSVPPLAAVNITTATVVKAAWSLVLSRFAATSDIVFGHIISGRNVDGVSGIEHIVGPCLNLVPVRVRFDHSWTGLQLLQHIQEQQVENMPYESLGFQEVIDKCTDWNASGKRQGFSTVVQHQNMPQTGSLKLGGNEYTVGALASQEDIADFSIVTTPVDVNEIEVCLVYAQDGAVGDLLPKQIMETLCQMIRSITRNPLGVIGWT